MTDGSSTTGRPEDGADRAPSSGAPARDPRDAAGRNGPGRSDDDRRGSTPPTDADRRGSTPPTGADRRSAVPPTGPNGTRPLLSRPTTSSGDRGDGASSAPAPRPDIDLPPARPLDPAEPVTERLPAFGQQPDRSYRPAGDQRPPAADQQQHAPTTPIFGQYPSTPTSAPPVDPSDAATRPIPGRSAPPPPAPEASAPPTAPTPPVQPGPVGGRADGTPPQHAYPPQTGPGGPPPTTSSQRDEEAKRRAEHSARNPNLSSFTTTPLGVVDRDELREARRRSDRTLGITLLVFGLFATIMNMTVFTENSLAMQFATVFEQYEAGTYVRPSGLGALSLVGIIGHPIIYAVFLYLTLVRWRAERRAAWIPLIGAVVATVFTIVLITIGMAMHPELIAALTTTGGVPQPSP